ncbi:MAG: WecB/TagA/CpsF family glycosyltransferase [Tissierellia bacterium]|nr:WecB/TagA/CpsF family glycosyltransferase [Tissierellia bacterium]
MKKIRIFDIQVDNLSFQEVLDSLEEALVGEDLFRVYTPNTEIAMATKDQPQLAQLVNSADLVLADGIGLVLGSKIQGCPLKERVTGYDVSMALLEIAQRRGYGVYLLGGKEGVAQEAKARLERARPQLKIVGCHHGYFKGAHVGASSQEEERLLEDIQSSGAKILFTGLGFPGQEKWLSHHQDQLGPVRVAIGNGGVIDILAGRARRAPDIFIKLHLEWFYRLLSDPSRIKRQAALPKFVIEMLKNKEAIGYFEEEN